MTDNAVSRFLGGKPSSVAIKLIIISVIVGALLHFAGLSPAALVRGIGRMIESLIGSGWDAVRTVFEFAVYGAMIVVPIWLIARLLASRKA
ncbi:MAG: DUF6460 domain-containing protein [Beijerinckiaceae bacterium]